MYSPSFSVPGGFTAAVSQRHPRLWASGDGVARSISTTVSFRRVTPNTVRVYLYGHHVYTQVVNAQGSTVEEHWPWHTWYTSRASQACKHGLAQISVAHIVAEIAQQLPRAHEIRVKLGELWAHEHGSDVGTRLLQVVYDLPKALADLEARQPGMRDTILGLVNVADLQMYQYRMPYRDLDLVKRALAHTEGDPWGAMCAHGRMRDDPAIKLVRAKAAVPHARLAAWFDLYNTGPLRVGWTLAGTDGPVRTLDGKTDPYYKTFTEGDYQ
jgi:hypothetical protein